MKRMISMALLAAMTLGLFSACQETPENPIVVGKNESILIEKAKSNVAAGEVTEKIDAPANYQHDFLSPDNQIAIIIDADVVVPEMNAVPVLRVSSGRITQEQADVLLTGLTHTVLYDPYGAPSKSEIMQQILDRQAQIAAGPSEEDLEMTYYDSKGNAIAWEAWMQSSLDALYKEYRSAAEEPHAAPISGRFIKEGDMELIYGEGISSEHGYEGLQIQNGSGQGNSRALYSQNCAPDGFAMDYEIVESPPTDIPDIMISSADAKLLCDMFTEKLSIEHMAHYSTHKKYMRKSETNPARICWVLQYTRRINGLPITYTQARGDTMIENAYIEPWPYETLTYYVNDAGIVGMHWEAPYDALETVIKDSTIMSFREIMDVFEKMFVIANAGRIKGATVSEIRLGYMRTAAQNDTKTALLIPVWDFFGTLTLEDDTCVDYPEMSLLTINAIDGSIIDRALGY